MNLQFLILTLAAPACILAGEPVGAKRSVAQESLALLEKTFPYQPTVSQKTEEKKESGGEVVKLEPFVVVESLFQRELSKKIESELRRKKNEQFSITKGGSIYKNERIEIGAWSNQDLFKEDAKYKDKMPMVKIDLVHFRF